ncbi:mitochondrial FAD carrier protein flx1 [Thecaphora frezii]
MSNSTPSRTTPPPPDDQPTISTPPDPAAALASNSNSASASASASASSSAASSSASPSSFSSSSSSSARPPASQPSGTTPPFFPTHALDHAFAGIAAGAAATVCMNPLDLIKTKFQVDTTKPRSFRFRNLSRRYSSAAATSSSAAAPAAEATQQSSAHWKGKARSLAGDAGEAAVSRARSGVQAVGTRCWRYYALGGRIGHDMIDALKDIVRTDGWKGLYRGLSPNVVGNSASWGLYFLWYTMIKEHMASGVVADADGVKKQLSAGQHLLAASESGAITALMTNPIWVVKTRMFTTPTSLAKAGAKDAPEVYRGLWHGLSSIARKEGLRGLYKGAGLALFGVSNGAIQFMAYEELKKWRTAVALRKLRAAEADGGRARSNVKADGDKVMLRNIEYIIMSGTSKVAAILLTYPYQVIRSRIQNHATAHIYPNIPTCIRLTYTQEGVRAFYKGLVPNLVRILPGTCVTFVVYENVSWGLRGLAQRREKRLGGIETAS